jgi:hypothetical protein
MRVAGALTAAGKRVLTDGIDLQTVKLEAKAQVIGQV